MMSSKGSGPAAIWEEEIERSESYLVCSLYEEAASSASSILKWLSKHSEDLEAGDPFELYDMLESAGMVLVQSLKQLGRTSEILNELKLLFASVPTIPVQLLLTGACFYISEGHSHGIQEFLEEFLSRWSFVNEQYVLVGTGENADDAEKCDGPFLLGVDKYLEVVEVLLRRLHSLHSVKATTSSQGSFSSLLADEAHSTCLKEIAVLDRYPKTKYPPNEETAKNPAVFNLSKRLEPCVWWFHTITLKFGSARVVISKGKIVLGFLILLIYYVFQRKQATLKRMLWVDLWQLAFSYQVNPLAAVQPLAAATRAGQ
ncbi:hypothetical protein PRUPE_3G126100 [Prunus persica]|uniref:Protein APEM9 n=1 Tax=Prunus persica TaxID=3760 RepID=A0A251Q2F5_PRUPE|nr:hypothetical protein PRUPE_3G126100 [Prunus persica]